MRVANRKCIRRLSIQHMKSAKTRNIITIMAIVLTTVLFTALFTAGMSIKYGYETTQFRRVGGYAHGTFKRLTREQYELLQDDPLIQEHGERLYLGTPQQSPFLRSQVEISYCDSNMSKWMFLTPTTGRLPEEGTNEAATDTTVLKLLGVEPVIGSEFTITFTVDGTETTRSFILCGFWERDEAIGVSHVLLPRGRVETIMEELDVQGYDGMTGLWTMDVMFKNSANIQKNMETVLERHGYQSEEISSDGYIGIGINWGYLDSQLNSTANLVTLLAIIAALALITFTGYLVIYNIFQISVFGDVRFYGLLKTIGTTGRQIRKILLIQALVLSMIGIPIGEVIGYGVGVIITRVGVSGMADIDAAYSVSPLIFLGAAAFSLITVLLSCRKPRKMAAKVSPIEALRYTEGSQSKKRIRRAKKGASMARMAWANLGRNKKKTVVTVVSLSLAVVILELTYTLTMGFDMDKYCKEMTQDFVLSSSFHYQQPARWEDIPEAEIAQIESQVGVTGGRTYGKTTEILELASEEAAREIRSDYMSKNETDLLVGYLERAGDLVADNIQLYGMEDFVLDKLTVVEGDIGRLKENGRYIAAVYLLDDYGDIRPYTSWASVGDQVTLRYVDETEYYNPSTGNVYGSVEEIGNRLYARRSVAYTDVTYEVCAIVTIPRSLEYLWYGYHAFVMGADTFLEDTGTESVLYYAFDCDDSRETAMEDYMEQLKEADEMYDYRSKRTYEEDFYGFRDSFMMIGTACSFVVALIGVLNFLNAILTSIFARKKEFAVLQSVGMTGTQLNRMLMIEGIIFACSALVITLLLSVVLAPFIRSALESMYWFFSYHFTVVPIMALAPVFALLGAFLPFAVYRTVVKRSIVERLREAE